MELEEWIEVALFTSGRVMSVPQLNRVFGTTHSTAVIRKAIEALNREYETTGRVFRIQETAGGFQMRTLKQYRQWVQKIETIKPIKLSLSVIETLAIIAYKQPVTRAGIEAIRGVDSAYTLRVLMEKKLIKIVGKADVPGRPSLYGTTLFFLQTFNLKELKNLPPLSELN